MFLQLCLHVGWHQAAAFKNFLKSYFVKKEYLRTASESGSDDDINVFKVMRIFGWKLMAVTSTVMIY